MRILVLFALLPLVACEGDFTYNVNTGTEVTAVDVEQGVRDHLETNYSLPVESVSCEASVSTPSAEIGAVVAVVPCVVEQPDGAPYRVEVRTVNAALPDGEPTQNDTISMPGSVIIPVIEQKLGAHFAELSAESIEAVCDGPRVVPSTPGDTVDCRISDSANQNAVVITITDTDGGIDFEVIE